MGPPVLSLSNVLDRCEKVVFIPQPTDAPAFGPPVVTASLKSHLETAGGPRFQIGADLFGMRVRRGNHNMKVVRAAIDRMQVPASVEAGLSNLFFDGIPLLAIQTTGILTHSGGGF